MATSPTPNTDAGRAAVPPRPLVIVTRPQPQAEAWVRRLHALGQPAQALPLLGIAPPADPSAVAASWAGLAAQDLVMFVSPAAVERFFAQRPTAYGWPAGTEAGATGPGTAAALREAGVPAARIVVPPAGSPRFDSEALWAQMQRRRAWTGARVLIVRGEGGRDWLADTLAAAGAQVAFVEAYRRTAPALDGAGQALMTAALARPDRHVWLLSSSEAAGHLPALAPQADWRGARALATHPRIAESARRLGFGRVDTVAPAPEAVADALAAAGG